MNVSKREKVLIIIALIFAVFCLYYFFFLQPYSEDMAKLTEQIFEKDSQLSSNQQLVLNNAAVSKIIEENEQTLLELKSNVPQGYDQPRMLVYLEETVTSHATKDKFLFSDVRQSGHLYISPVMVSMYSDYVGLQKILLELAEGEYFVKMTGMTVSVRSDLQSQVEADQEETPAADEDIVSSEPRSHHFLEVTLYLEFYSLLGERPVDTVYDFGQYQYEADIFR